MSLGVPLSRSPPPSSLSLLATSFPPSLPASVSASLLKVLEEHAGVLFPPNDRRIEAAAFGSHHLHARGIERDTHMQAEIESHNKSQRVAGGKDSVDRNESVCVVGSVPLPWILTWSYPCFLLSSLSALVPPRVWFALREKHNIVKRSSAAIESVKRVSCLNFFPCKTCD